MVRYSELWNNRPVRFYRSLLLLYPSEFRDEYGRELCLALADRCREQRTRLGILLVWIHAALGILAEAPKEHYHVMTQDIRHALRVMWKDAPITAAAIAVLALGIGSTTAVFSLVNGILVRPLPYPEPDRLIASPNIIPSPAPHSGKRGISELSRYSRPHAIAARLRHVCPGAGHHPRRRKCRVSSRRVHHRWNISRVGRQATSGKNSFKRGGHAKWAQSSRDRPRPVAAPLRQRSRNPGRVIEIRGVRRTVIGVMPSSFHFPERADVWIPLQLSPRTPHAPIIGWKG